MKPELCFLLCETPIIYIKENVCRCSGSGLTANNKVECYERESYSAYVENEFYREHAHLFHNRIQFTSCELWNKSGFYDTLQVKIEQSSDKSPLNQLEQCAITCLDRNAAIKSIAFNGDNKQFLCILSQNSTKTLNNTSYLTILSNSSCDRYCDNKLSESNVKNKFKCGSSTDTRIWAVYNLNRTCPLRSVFIEELNECIYPYETSSDYCPDSAGKEYVYDGSVKWDIFLKAIEKLKLTNDDVGIKFDYGITINASWKCPTISAIDSEDTTSYSSNYILKNGCLRLQQSRYSYSSYRYSYSYSYSYKTRLCIPNRVNDGSSSNDTDESSGYHESVVRREWHKCRSNWLYINENCYRISNNRKTIQEARNRCIDSEEKEAWENDERPISPYHSNYDSYYDERNELISIGKNMNNDLYKGEIVQYAHEWEPRIGFYLLDQSKVSKNGKESN